MHHNHTWKKTFFTITIGQAISLLGSAGVQFALIWWLAEQTASPFMMGLSGLAAFIPMTFLSPLAGVVADRYNRKWICVISDMSVGIFALGYALLLFRWDLPAWTILLVLFFRGIVGTFHQPSLQSIMPQLVPADQLIKTNGWIQLMNSGSFMLGPVIGAVMYGILPMWLILLTDFIGAAIASLTLASAKIPPLTQHAPRSEKFLHQFKEGLAVFREDRQLYYIVICEALCMFFYAPLSSFYPLMTSDYFNLSAIYGSIVEMCYALGMMGAALLFSSVLKIKRKILTSYIGLLGLASFTAICGLLPPVFWAWLILAAGCALMGAFANVHSIPLTAYMQESIAPEKMGRAFSVTTLIASLTMPVGLVISSPIAEIVGVHTWFLISGIGMLILTVCVMVCARSAKASHRKDRKDPLLPDGQADDKI